MKKPCSNLNILDTKVQSASNKTGYKKIAQCFNYFDNATCRQKINTKKPQLSMQEKVK